jgi:hypothetical protein
MAMKIVHEIFFTSINFKIWYLIFIYWNISVLHPWHLFFVSLFALKTIFLDLFKRLSSSFLLCIPMTLVKKYKMYFYFGAWNVLLYISWCPWCASIQCFQLSMFWCPLLLKKIHVQPSALSVLIMHFLTPLLIFVIIL